MGKETRSSLMKKAWKLMSELVRRGASDWRGYAECYTCRQVKQWKELDCGHYIHNKLDFDQRNLKPQCTYCNKYISGNLGKYAERLIEENGEKWLRQLRKDADLKGNNYKMQELRDIIEELKVKLSKLE